MKFLYKIYSNYDGFTPRQIPTRLLKGHFLKLGWTRYLDSVDVGAECWIYFHGPHAFTAGVYVKGFISDIDRNRGYAMLRVREQSTHTPLTDPETTARVADVVSVRYRQVFLWPEEWDVVPDCHRESCQQRLCANCATWQALPVIDEAHLAAPAGVRATAIVPAYWIIPTRCYLYAEHKQPAPSTNRITHIFGEFKIGERSYAYPLARGIFEALGQAGRLEFDAIIPIPLSPDKAEAGEVHRTRLLAQELSRLLGVPAREHLSLIEPISKRRMLAAGYSLGEFRRRYYQALRVSDRVTEYSHALLVDDVITRGATVSCATRRLVEANPQLDIVVASAGQMIVKPAVRDESSFVA